MRVVSKKYPVAAVGEPPGVVRGLENLEDAEIGLGGQYADDGSGHLIQAQRPTHDPGIP